MIRVIGILVCLILSVLSGGAIWFPFKSWCFAQVPAVQYAGLIKIAILIGVGYFGGIGIPLIFIVLAFMCWQLDG